MADYTPPVRDISFTLDTISGIDSIADLPGFEHVETDMVDGLLDEVKRLYADTKVITAHLHRGEATPQPTTQLCSYGEIVNFDEGSVVLRVPRVDTAAAAACRAADGWCRCRRAGCDYRQGPRDDDLRRLHLRAHQ